jgi:hypothetical protein
MGSGVAASSWEDVGGRQGEGEVMGWWGSEQSHLHIIDKVVMDTYRVKSCCTVIDPK